MIFLSDGKPTVDVELTDDALALLLQVNFSPLSVCLSLTTTHQAELVGCTFLTRKLVVIIRIQTLVPFSVTY